ncbi:ditrans,polycis-undecaprenyl-diphosphate synthase [bacterium BMS3Bbin10]|nr:ditrans,polycis-undecaprenyl-diphosphate synthase [bacterium BMS3Bbin10]
MPQHVAIIMDGNGRWAAKRGLSRSEGHKHGVESVRAAVRAAIDLNLPYLTLFSFSSENWSRPQSEIRDLMTLLRRFIRTDLADLHRQGVRIRIIGARKGIEGDIVRLIEDAVALTSKNSGLQLTVAFNYGSRDEIARAARRMAELVREGKLEPEDITPQAMSEFLDTSGLPDPDLLIRTSGEIRLSNFLLWQCAYTEFVFLDIYWPDFTGDTLASAIELFRDRERRFGGLRAGSTA